jgi:hypothetical protein
MKGCHKNVQRNLGLTACEERCFSRHTERSARSRESRGQFMGTPLL